MAEYWELKEVFADIRYCHAITAHRSQGSTYEEVWVDGGPRAISPSEPSSDRPTARPSVQDFRPSMRLYARLSVRPTLSRLVELKRLAFK